VAYVGDWNNTGDRPCWSFYSSGKSAAEVISHEIGHTLGLSHDGRTSPSEGYFGGHGSGAVGWAPIMGVGYYQPVAQWSKGEYANANQSQNDLSIVVNNNNNVDYRTDDTGPSLATARHLEVQANFAAAAEGVIERTADTDAFRFTTAGGFVSLTANVVGTWADLAIMATLADETDTIIASNNPQSQLAASVATNLPAGTYTFRVTGAGRNDPATTGFSDYASLGYYAVAGSVQGAVLPSRFTVAENSTNGTVVGTVVAPNPDGDPLDYVITSGNTSGTFAITTNGLVTVANAAALNYEALAAQTQLTVQYQLFVDIINLVNPALTELNRRVVVQVQDVNEAPALSGFNVTLLSRTQPGTIVGKVVATDPDAYAVLSLAIIAGNSNGMFAVDSATGALKVAGNLNSATQNSYTLTVETKDGGTPKLGATGTVQVTVVNNATPFQPGSVSYATYDGIGNGNLVTDLTSNTRFPTDPTSEKQMPTCEGSQDRADSFGSVMRGYLIPPQSGNYTFWIASDDGGELWLSSSTNPASMGLIASVNGYTSPRQWTKYASQQSALRTLTAGQGYYIEARQKEGGGGDHLAVAWRGPATANQTNVISGLYLAPRFINYVPRLTGFTNNAVRRNLLTGARLGRVNLTDVNPTNTHTFAILSGNTSGIFSVDNAGWVRVASEAALAGSATTSFTLSIRATDNGAPALSATATVALALVGSNGITPTVLHREMFTAIGSGTAVSDLTGNAKYPGKPDALTPLPGGDFSTAVNAADNYGSRVRGYLVPDVSGDYRFFLASDDGGQLKLGSSTNPATATVIASVNGSTGQNEWTKFASQTSPLRSLVAGERYYLEALQKEGGGGDHLSVGWLVPGNGVTNIIPAANLEPIDINVAPQISSQSFTVLQGAPNGSIIGRVTATDGPLDLFVFKILSGNANNTFGIVPETGDLTVQNNTLIANGTLNNVTLTVAVQDSGLGGLYPLRTAQAVMTVRVTNAPPASAPSPAANEFNVEFNRVLTWSGATNVLHDVYFGTTAAAVTAATTSAPEYKGRRTTTTFNPGALSPAKNYYWRVDEITGSLVSTGSVWRFSTAESTLAARLLVHLTLDTADLSGPTLTNVVDVAPAPDRFALVATIPNQPGMLGEAFSFNGSSSYARSFNNDLVPGGSPGGTLSAWFKTASTASGTQILSVEGAWVLQFDRGAVQAFFDGNTTGNPTIASGLNDNNWHHVLATSDGILTAVHVDGTLLSLFAEPRLDLGSLARQTCVGASYDGTTARFAGLVDDVAIWGRALSAGEALQIYTNGLAGRTTDPLTLLDRTGFEATEGFTGYESPNFADLGTKTDSFGVEWSTLAGDVAIWNRSDIPPKGVQCLKLGETAADSLCRVRIPGAADGAGIVTFDWASFTTTSSGTFSLSWSNQNSGGWVEAWSAPVVGQNPNWQIKPWATVAVPINAIGDVDLLFKWAGTKGVLVDNFRLTGRTNNSAPFFLANPTLATNAPANVAFAETLSGRAADADSGDALAFNKVNGPAWLNIATDGALTGLPRLTDVGTNDFMVRVTDSLGRAGDSLVRIVVEHLPPEPPTIASSLSGADLQMQIASQPGYEYVLQAATNLVPPVVWSDITTNSGTGGPIQFSVPVSPAISNQYYRVLAY
jgi:hypothetical protein